MWLFLIIILIIIYNNSQPSSSKKNQRSGRNTNYYAPNMTQRQRQELFRKQQEQMLNNLAGMTRTNNNPYKNNYNPYLRNNMNNTNPYQSFSRTNYGSPTMPNTQPYQATVNSFGLPSSERKRRKIVSKFNNRYGLNLSDGDIEQIVKASYMSTSWSREICYMNQKYETVYSWFATSNPWLKAYMFAFPLQQISSDFAMQEQIVFNAFDQIFKEILTKPDITVPEAIWEINSKFYTQFDESTFMIAYRFMEQKGKKYPLNLGDVIKGTSDIDALLSKYETSQQGTPMR